MKVLLSNLQVTAPSAAVAPSTLKKAPTTAKRKQPETALITPHPKKQQQQALPHPPKPATVPPNHTQTPAAPKPASRPRSAAATVRAQPQPSSEPCKSEPKPESSRPMESARPSSPHKADSRRAAQETMKQSAGASATGSTAQTRQKQGTAPGARVVSSVLNMEVKSLLRACLPDCVLAVLLLLLLFSLQKVLLSWKEMQGMSCFWYEHRASAIGGRSVSLSAHASAHIYKQSTTWF